MRDVAATPCRDDDDDTQRRFCLPRHVWCAAMPMPPRCRALIYDAERERWCWCASHMLMIAAPMFASAYATSADAVTLICRDDDAASYFDWKRMRVMMMLLLLYSIFWYDGVCLILMPAMPDATVAARYFIDVEPHAVCLIILRYYWLCFTRWLLLLDVISLMPPSHDYWCRYFDIYDYAADAADACFYASDIYATHFDVVWCLRRCFSHYYAEFIWLQMMIDYFDVLFRHDIYALILLHLRDECHVYVYAMFIYCVATPPYLFADRTMIDDGLMPCAILFLRCRWCCCWFWCRKMPYRRAYLLFIYLCHAWWLLYLLFDAYVYCFIVCYLFWCFAYAPMMMPRHWLFTICRCAARLLFYLLFYEPAPMPPRDVDAWLLLRYVWDYFLALIDVWCHYDWAPRHWLRCRLYDVCRAPSLFLRLRYIILMMLIVYMMPMSGADYVDAWLCYGAAICHGAAPMRL